jgi:hypothetical protein
MPKKKTPQPQYIAVDTDHYETIALGSREQVTEELEAYIESNGFDEVDIAGIRVYQLGQEHTVLITKSIELSLQLND